MALTIQRLLNKQQSFTEQVCEPAAIAQTMALRIKLNAEFFQVKEDLHILRDTVSEKEVRQYLYAAVEDDPRYADFITEQSNDNTSYVDKCRFKRQATDGMVVAPPTVTVIEMSVTVTIIQKEILKVAMPIIQKESLKTSRRNHVLRGHEQERDSHSGKLVMTAAQMGDIKETKDMHSDVAVLPLNCEGSLNHTFLRL